MLSFSQTKVFKMFPAWCVNIKHMSIFTPLNASRFPGYKFLIMKTKINTFYIDLYDDGFMFYFLCGARIKQKGYFLSGPVSKTLANTYSGIFIAKIEE